MALDCTGGHLSLYGETQPGGDPFTAMVWAYWDGALSTRTNVMRLGSASPRLEVYNQTDAHLDLILIGGGTTYHYGSTTLVTQTWHHIAITRNGTAFKTFIDGVVDLDFTRASLGSVTNRYLSKSGQGSAFNGRMAAFKNWDAELTVSEIQQELDFFTPIRSDPTMWTPFVADESAAFRNYSGSAVGDWNVNGSLGAGPGPPITWRKGASKIFIPAAAAADISHVAALADSFDNVVQRRPIKVTSF